MNIISCYNTGKISGKYNVAGIVGFKSSAVSKENIGKISYSYNTGDIQGEYSLGGIVGTNNDYGEIYNCYKIYVIIEN